MVLITGGLGFIGSHTTVELIAKGFEVVIVDDLSNSTMEVLEGIEKTSGVRPIFEKIDLKDKSKVNDLFDRYDIDGVIHFAASKAVGESVENPLKYYENNIIPLINILHNAERKNKKFNFIFSSSCTVYGQAAQMPIKESAPIIKANSPYGNTKQIGEEILEDAVTSNSIFSVVNLRYFNPVGAHPLNHIGELPKGTPQNLVPFITQTAAGLRDQLMVFGDDYPTPDGTCIRDYIHVVDLAKAHVKALKVTAEKSLSAEPVNLGTGTGYSVKEVLDAFEKENKIKVNTIYGERRKGDIESIYADPSYSKELLDWEAELGLKEMVTSVWNWQKRLPKKCGSGCKCSCGKK